MHVTHSYHSYLLSAEYAESCTQNYAHRCYRTLASSYTDFGPKPGRTMVWAFGFSFL